MYGTDGQLVRDDKLGVSLVGRYVHCRKAEVACVRISGVARAKAGTGAELVVLPTHLSKK